MADHADIERIAAAMNAVRPDWSTRSLTTFLTRHHTHRAARDLAIAAIAVATDPRTQTPQLLNQHGPWWAAAQTATGTADPIRFERCPQIGHGSYLAHHCGACRSEQLEAAAAEHAARTAPTPEHLDAYARGARTARAAIRTPERTDPA